MNYRVIIQPSAADDIDSACRWIAERNPGATAAWYNRMEAAVQSLADLPQRCLLAEESRAFDREIRQLVVGRRGGAYRVLFTIEGDKLQVLHVRHGRRRRLRPEKSKSGKQRPR